MSILTGSAPTDSALPQAPVPASDEQVLERRQEARLAINVPVTVTVLGMNSEGIMQARVLDVSGKGMKVRLPLPVAVGAPVQVETDDSLFLGEASYSEAVEGGYIVGLILSHSLTALAELDRLNRALIDEESKTPNSMRRGHAKKKASQK
jgi:hypothetical protein